MIQIPLNVQELLPYKPGMPSEELANRVKLKRIVKLASNENPIGSSPKAIDLIREKIDRAHIYPNQASPQLVNSISEKLLVDHSKIICGSGIDSLLASIIIACSSGGDEIVTSCGTFIGIYVHARKFNRTLVQTELKNWGYDLQAILKSVSDKTKIIYIANPNNPTGSMFFRDEFKEFIEKVPDNVLVVLDEAYNEYACSYAGYVDGIEFKRENLITMRTFSKVYGLAGLRVGYAIGHEKIIAQIYKVKMPFEPNRLGQFAACAALGDDEFVEQTVELNQNMLTKMCSFFDSIKLPYVKSWANFVLLIMPSRDFALNFHNACLEKGLILRHVEPFGISNGIRVTTGMQDDTFFALNIIEEVWLNLK